MEIQKKDNFLEIVKWLNKELYTEYDNQFLRDEFKKFCNYWTETNKKWKERWEAEKFFCINKRFSRWLLNAKKYSCNKKTYDIIFTNEF